MVEDVDALQTLVGEAGGSVLAPPVVQTGGDVGRDAHAQGDDEGIVDEGSLGVGEGIVAGVDVVGDFDSLFDGLHVVHDGVRGVAGDEAVFDAGAAEGWETYKGGLKDYLKWLSAAAPDLRRQTGTECSAAIQRYAQLTVTLDSTDTAWTLHLGNFVDEAWLFFRANEGTPGKVTGGELTRLTGDLYLLKANADTVRIEKKGA